MRVVIMTSGTRGDVQPYVALGLGLRRAGYHVCVLTHDIFKPMVVQYGLEFASLTGNPREMVEKVSTQSSPRSEENALRFTRSLAEVSKSNQVALAKDAQRTLTGAHLLLYSPLCFAGSYVAEALDIPAIFAPLQPVLPTRAFPYPMTFSRSLGGIGNRLTHTFVNVSIWQMMRSVMQPIRRDLGLKPLPASGSISWLYRHHQPIILGYSSLVVPRPADWPDWVQVAGYWFLDAPQNWQPPAALLDFLAGGPPPVYIGFGSMVNRKAEETTHLIVKALERSKQRGIIATGWGGLSNADLPDTVFKLDEAPHDWLFPRMAAVVHHAGAGTTAAGLRAGVPGILLPFLADQYFWAERVHLLGVGPRPIPRNSLTTEKLAQAIMTTLSDQAIRTRAAELGRHIRAENGVGKAVQVVQKVLASHVLH